MSADAMTFAGLLARLADGVSLSEAEAEAAFGAIMEGLASPAQMAAFLMALRVRGESVAEITGAVRAMWNAATPAKAPSGAIDIVGTGGDGHGTYNISTAAALVTAGAGVPVAKHGNRSVSSKSGAADVLTALGIDVDAPLERVEQAIREAGIGFLMAPRHHPAMRHVAPVRKELGLRTVFNILGPLANPAGVTRQFTGVFDPKWCDPMAEALKALGTEACWVVHGADGLDELSTTGTSQVTALEGGRLARFQVSPEDAGLARTTLDRLLGGGPEENAAALRRVLDGEAGPYRDVVVLNAAGALIVSGKATDLKEAARLAADAIDQGRARKALEKLLELTGKAAEETP